MESFDHQRASGSLDAEFELIAASVPQVVWIAAPHGWSEYFNQHASLGPAPEAEANGGWKWLELLHPEDADRTARAWRDAIAAEVPLAIEHRLLRRDGVYRVHACEALPVSSSDGEIVSWIGTLIDREDHRELEQTLHAARRWTGESLALLETLQSTRRPGSGSSTARTGTSSRARARLPPRPAATAPTALDQGHPRRVAAPEQPSSKPALTSRRHSVPRARGTPRKSSPEPTNPASGVQPISRATSRVRSSLPDAADVIESQPCRRTVSSRNADRARRIPPGHAQLYQR